MLFPKYAESQWDGQILVMYKATEFVILHTKSLGPQRIFEIDVGVLFWVIWKIYRLTFVPLVPSMPPQKKQWDY